MAESHEHTAHCPLFRITARSNGLVDVSVCWDQIDTPGVAQRLREIADGLDKAPPGAEAIGVIPYG